MSGGSEESANEFVSLVFEIGGEAAAARLFSELGGEAVKIPRNPLPGHRLCQVLGVEAVAEISRRFGWGEVEVPKGFTSSFERRRAAIATLLSSGLSVREVARRLGVHSRTVFRHRRRLPRA